MSVEIVDWVEGKFWKKAADSELGKESRIKKTLSSFSKYRAVVKKSGEDKPVRRCYELQVGKPKEESWVGRSQKTKHNWTSLPCLDAGGDRNKNKVPLDATKSKDRGGKL